MAVDTEESVNSAIKKDITEGEYMLDHLKERLDEFEEEHGMDSEEFMQKFESGELGDKEDFFEWHAVIQSINHLEQKTENLKKKA